MSALQVRPRGGARTSLERRAGGGRGGGGSRFRRILIVLGGLLVLLGLLTFQAYRAALYSADDLRSAAVVLKAGPQFLIGSQPFSQDVYGQVKGAIERAQQRVENANWSFGVVGAIPILGRPVRAAQHLVEAASIELGSIELARTTVADITGADGLPPLMQGGRVDIPTLDRARTAIDRIVRDLNRVEELVGSVRPIPFAGETERLKEEAIGEIRAVRAKAGLIQRGLRTLPSFFGKDGERVYLIAVLNPAELHGVGGAFLSYGIVVARNGRLDLVSGGDPTELEPKNVPPVVTGPKGDYFVNEVWEPRLLYSFYGPDFVQGARLASTIAQARYGRPLDGVIAMDPIGLSYLLPAIGPLHPSAIVTLTAENFVRYAAHAQYRLYSYELRQGIQEQILAEVWAKMGAPTDPFGLLVGLSRALDEKRIMVWSRFAEEQRLFDSLRWAGRLNHGRGDWWLLDHHNLGGDKLDFYLRERLRYEVELRPSGEARVSLRVEMRNRASPRVPRPVGNNRGGMMRTLLGLLVPADARFGSAGLRDDRPSSVHRRDPVVASGYGGQLYAVSPWVGGRSKATITFRYSIPKAIVGSPSGPAYLLNLQYQPMVRPADLTVVVHIPTSMRIGELPAGWSARPDGAVFRTPLTKDITLLLPVIPG